jgi:hypothetical protein
MDMKLLEGMLRAFAKARAWIKKKNAEPVDWFELPW